MIPRVFRIRNTSIKAYLPDGQTIRETPTFDVFHEDEADDTTYLNYHPEAARKFHTWGEVLAAFAYQKGKSPITDIHAYPIKRS